MLFAIGTKVKFLHTGDEGVVKARLEKGMVSVYLPKDDMEIPAAEEDLIRAVEVTRNPVKAKVVEGKKEKKAPEPPAIKIETQYAILKSVGIQMAFLPKENPDGTTEKYTIYLLNDTKYDIIYNIKFWLNYRTETWSNKLPATAYVELGEMIYDDLNEAPEFDVETSWITTEGVGNPEHKLLKIKAKTFFNTLKTAPFLNKPCHLYRLAEKPSSEPVKEEEDLQSYTKRHAKPSWQTGSNLYSSGPDPSGMAHFPRELDLHIEALRDGSKKLSNSEILAIQLSAFDNYMNEAVKLGVPSVFVIHGVGKGKLRNEIATRLMKSPDIDTFKNEFHHRYGWGATEVIFMKDS